MKKLAIVGKENVEPTDESKPGKKVDKFPVPSIAQNEKEDKLRSKNTYPEKIYFPILDCTYHFYSILVRSYTIESFISKNIVML